MPWCPAGGLRYFDPYGDATGARWRQTLALLGAAQLDTERIVSGALLAFEILQAWLGHDRLHTGAGAADPAGAAWSDKA